MAAGVDIYRATMYHTATQGGNVPINNVYWFREIADQGGVGDTNLANDLAVPARWTTIRAQQHTSFTYDKVSVQRMWPVRNPPINVFFPAGTAGTSGGSVLPAICCMVLRLYGLSPGRSHQGRLFLGGFPVGATNGNVWNAGVMTAVGTWVTSFSLRYSGVVGGGGQFDWGIWSPKLSGGRPPTSAAGFSHGDHSQIDSVVRLQRSRELGVSRRHAGHH